MDFERIFAVADEIKRRKSSDGASPRSAGVSPTRAALAATSARHDITMALKFKRSLVRGPEERPGPGEAGPAGGGAAADDEIHQYDHHFKKKFPHSQSRYAPKSGSAAATVAAPQPTVSVTLPTMAPLPSFGSRLGAGEPPLAPPVPGRSYPAPHAGGGGGTGECSPPEPQLSD